MIGSMTANAAAWSVDCDVMQTKLKFAPMFHDVLHVCKHIFSISHTRDVPSNEKTQIIIYIWVMLANIGNTFKANEHSEGIL